MLVFIYFMRIGDSGPIKIGSARNPLRRLSDIQCCNHQEVKLLAVMESTEKFGERDAHAMFECARVRGEWFLPIPDLIAFIEKAKCNQIPGLEPRTRGMAHVIPYDLKWFISMAGIRTPDLYRKRGAIHKKISKLLKELENPLTEEARKYVDRYRRSCG